MFLESVIVLSTLLVGVRPSGSCRLFSGSFDVSSG